jgi:type II secretory pathway pseudopilin PulG
MEAIMRAGNGCLKRAGGFTYIAVLIALAIFGLGLAAVGESWGRISQREKEGELLEAGFAYAQAIERYYQRSPSAIKSYPRQLADLLEDARFIGIERHLRRLYPDPMAHGQEWGLVRDAQGGIIGVYSRSVLPTLRRQPLPLPGTATLLGQRYCDWLFVYRP